MKTTPTPENIPQLLEEIATDMSTTSMLESSVGYQEGLREYAGILRFAAAHIRGLRNDSALAQDVLKKSNEWILEAKPLLEEGGEYQRKYLELLYQVGQRHEGESRHETALRYLREREAHHEGPASVATHHHD